MKITTLYDESADELYNLTALVKQYGNELSVGRKESNIIVLGEGRTLSDEKSSLLLTVSGEHAFIFHEFDGFYIQDVSRNGTKINGNPITPYEKTILRDGDEIFFGDYGPVKIEEFNSGEFPAVRE